MAKRAPIVDETFNPVASHMERYKRSTAEQRTAEVEKGEDTDAAEVPAAAKAESKAPSARAAAETADAEAPAEKIARRAIAPKRELATATRPEPRTRVLPPEPPAPEPEPDPTPAPQALEAMTSSLRARVTESEREHYTKLTYWLTGKQNQFSSVARALLLLLEHAQENGELDNRLEAIHALERPAPKDRLGMAFYEYQLAEIFWDAIESAGRPKRG